MENTIKKKVNQTVEKRKAKTKQNVLNVLKEMPIIEVVVKRVGISRDTFYRWKTEDKDFARQSQEAMNQGIEFINDMSESQLISLIKDRSYQSIIFWLRHHHPKYVQKIEITTREPEEELNPEQEALVKEALRLAGVTQTVEESNIKINQEANHETKQPTPNQQSAEPTKGNTVAASSES